MKAEQRHAKCLEIANVIFGEIPKNEQLLVSLNKLQLFYTMAIAEERERIAEMLYEEDWTFGAALVRANK
jgi:hypothetical protein